MHHVPHNTMRNGRIRRKVMAEAAREAGNLCTKWESCQAALERYTLALMLDADNLSARCNRARIYLMVSPFVTQVVWQIALRHQQSGHSM